MPDEQTDDKPPYLSLTTLTNFFDKWGEGPIPPRIDKSALDNYSGGTQASLLSTLKLMGLVGSDGQVTPAMREILRDEDARKAYLTTWARRFYSTQLALAEQNGTAGMLHESFAGYGYTGSTLRKAVVFYLSLVEYLNLPNSPHFRPPKQSATPTARRRTTRTRTATETFEPTPQIVQEPRAPRGEVTEVRIGDLATITIAVDAQWMKLPVETITAMREAIGKLEALATNGTDDLDDDEAE